MPPKKTVDASKAVTGDEATPVKESVKDGINVEDYNLPKSIVTRLAKGVLPPNTQIQGNAMLAMTKGATLFINYLTGYANEYAQRDGRKTLNPNDVFRALEEIEFPDFKPRLEAELAKFNEIQADKRNAHKNKAVASKGPGKAASPAQDGEEGGNGEPAAKRARIDAPDSAGDEAHSDVEDEEEQDDDEVEEDADENIVEVDEQIAEEEREEQERSDDEALDNGDDSD